MSQNNFGAKNENFILESFLKWFNDEDENYRIIGTPNPPDAIIEDEHSGDQTWVEVTTCYYSKELAEDYTSYYHPHRDHVPMESEHGYTSMDKSFAESFWKIVKKKLKKRRIIST